MKSNLLRKNKRLLQLVIGVSAALGVSHMVYGQTLAEAVKTTLDTHPSAAAACYSEQASYEAMLASRGGLLPQANFTASGGRERTTDPTGNGVTNSTNTTLSPYSANFTIKQLLFDGSATYNTYRAAKERRFSANYQNQSVRQRLTFAMATAYLDVIRFRQLKQLSQHNVDVHKSVMGNAQMRYDSGAGQRADLELVQARLSQAESRLELFQTQLENSSATYFELAGERPKTLYFPTIPAEMLPEKFGTIGFCGNPDIQSAIYQMQAAKLESKAASSKFLYPRVEADFNYLKGHNLNGYEFDTSDVQGLIVISYDLFKGGSDYARVQEACARKLEARERLLSAQQSIEKDGNIAWNNIQSTIIRVKELQNYVDYLGLVLDAYRKQYDLNQRSMLNLLDIENELFNAEVSLVNEKLDQLKSVYSLFTTMGNIDQVILASNNSEDASKIEEYDTPLSDEYKTIPTLEELKGIPLTPPPGFNPPKIISNPSPTATAMLTPANPGQTGPTIACPFCNASLSKPDNKGDGKSGNSGTSNSTLVACPFCSGTLDLSKDNKSPATGTDPKSGNPAQSGSLVACPFCSGTLNTNKPDNKEAGKDSNSTAPNNTLVACPFCSGTLQAPDSKEAQPKGNAADSATLAMDDEDKQDSNVEKDKNSAGQLQSDSSKDEKPESMTSPSTEKDQQSTLS